MAPNQKINDDGKAIQNHIFAEQVKQLLSETRTSVAAGAVAITAMAIVNRDTTETFALWSWIVFVGVGVLSRTGVVWLHNRSNLAEQDSKYWRRICNLYWASIAWSGIAWGYSGILFLAPDIAVHSPVSAVILIGLSAGGMTSFTPILRVYLTFIILVLTPGAVNLIIRGTDTDLAFGVLAFVYMVFLSIYARSQNRIFTESFSLRYQKQDLVDNLTAEKESAEALNRSLAKEFLGRRAASERLETSEQRFHDIAAAASDWLWETDRFGNFIYLSERFEEVSGMAVGPVLGSPFESVLREWDVQMEPEIAHAYSEAIKNHEPFSNIVWAYMDDKDQRHFVRAGGTPYFDRNSGEFAGYRGTGTDITKSRQTGQELEEQSRLLQRAERAARVGHWRWTERTNDLFWSGEMYHIFGVKPGHFEPGLENVLEYIHPDDRAEYIDAWQQAARDRAGYEVEVRVLQKDGSVRYLWVQTQFEITETGDAAMFGIANDVTEFKLAEAALINARDEAERANQAKTEFLSGMSHELRTPMNAVLGFAQLLKADRDQSLTGSQEAFVDEILNSGHHMMELVNDVLDLAAIETGHVEIESCEIDPFKPLRECLTMVTASADAQGININKLCNRDNFPAVYADSRRLRQVFLNLLSNAIKYNAPGGSVDVGCQTLPDGFLRILVSDTGTGISDTHRDRIFEPFDRLGAENSGVSGTGVGLTVTRQLIELMNGRIGFDSVLEQGTTFWIDLPLVADTIQIDQEPAH